MGRRADSNQVAIKERKGLELNGWMPNHRRANSNPSDTNFERGSTGWLVPAICCSHLPFLPGGRASPDRRHSDAPQGWAWPPGTAPDSSGRQPTSWFGWSSVKDGENAELLNTA